MLRFLLAFAVFVGKNIVRNIFGALIEFLLDYKINYSSFMSYPFWIIGVIQSQQQPLINYQDTASWGGECASGMMQSPIDLPTDMKAEVHAPINYRNYFNGHFNKVRICPITVSIKWYNMKPN